MAHSANFEIAGTVFSIRSPDPLVLPEDFEPFLTQKTPDVHIESRVADHLDHAYGKLLFDSQSVWKFYELDGKFTFVFQSEAMGNSPYRTLSYRRGSCKYEILSRPDRILPSGGVNPFEHPLPQLLFISFLASGKGILSHAFGADMDGKGLLFLGNSGAGKSTMASLFKTQATVLNDDRIAITDGDKPRIHGTPWHGHNPEVHQGGVPLEAVFILEHGTNNRIELLFGARAVSEILARSFLPFWDPEGIQSMLKFSAKLTDRVPVYRLFFVPDESAVEYIMGVVK